MNLKCEIKIILPQTIIGDGVFYTTNDDAVNATIFEMASKADDEVYEFASIFLMKLEGVVGLNTKS